ncbi:MAG: 2-polyprenyl-3-methyl-6-methoxy-1,4-benzoquinone monooxygenase [Pseudomonadota bacterium]
MRKRTLFDTLITEFDRALRVSTGEAVQPSRETPHVEAQAASLNPAEKRLSARLMRVNHAGEIAAQALYQGQAMTARDPAIRQHMEHAAQEELDHLIWCKDRVETLGERVSALTPAWYAGSFAIGAIAGLVGDKHSLGFVAETERQVGEHLDRHLSRLPQADHESRQILEQMRQDEASHEDSAISAGGQRPPKPVRSLMRQVAKVMTGAAFRI